MKIFNDTLEGNEMAEFEPAKYILYSKEQINEHIDHLSSWNKPAQGVLVHLDILLSICKKYPSTAYDLIEESELKLWEKTYNEWYSRVEKKMPDKYKDMVNKNSTNLFNGLLEFTK